MRHWSIKSERTFPLEGNGNLLRVGRQQGGVHSWSERTFPLEGNGNPVFMLIMKWISYWSERTFPLEGNGNTETDIFSVITMSFRPKGLSRWKGMETRRRGSGLILSYRSERTFPLEGNGNFTPLRRRSV